MDASIEGIAAAAADAPCVPLLRSAKLFSIEGRMIVTVLALADEDAVATTESPPPMGSIAVLARSGIRVAATVAWVDGRRFGLRLDEPIDAPTVERFAGMHRADPLPAPAVAHAA